MKKYFFPILLISILPGIAFGASARFTQLVREKQQKMEQLEKCMGASKGLKIAGISTLGLTAVGVAGNIAEAKMIDSNTKTIAKNTEKIKTAQEDLDNAKLLAECKTALTDENANANADKITSVEKDENGKCKILTCDTGFKPVNNTCQEEKKADVTYVPNFQNKIILNNKTNERHIKVPDGVVIYQPVKTSFSNDIIYNPYTGQNLEWHLEMPSQQ